MIKDPMQRISNDSCGSSPFQEEERNATPLKCGRGIATFFRRTQHGKGEQETKSAVEKPGKHHLSQVIKVNTNSDDSWWQYVPPIWADENGTSPLDIIPQNHNPTLNMRKTPDKFQ